MRSMLRARTVPGNRALCRRGGEERGVRECDAWGVAREVGEHGRRSGERPLGVDDPLGAAQRRKRGVEGALVGERGEIAEEGEAASLMQAGEGFEGKAAEQAREHAHGEEEA